MASGPVARCGGRRGALIEPMVLAALMRHRSHGYDLRREILSATNDRVQVDVGGLYRTLRRLEDEGFVVSEWSEGEAGPQRRDYRITEQGRELAEEWAAHLRERAEIHTLVADALDAVREEGAL